MILIGQFDSPFVRRVGLALTLYGFDFEHRPWSVFGDADKIRQLNPLTRVPTLVLDDGVVLADSHLICAHLDDLAGPDRSLAGPTTSDRARVRHVVGLASGVSDKAVALFYELRLHEQTSSVWVERCTAQIRGAVAALESECAAHAASYWVGSSLTHADLAVACTLRHLRESLPELFDAAAHPALERFSSQLESTQPFDRIAQAFIPPA